MPDNFDAERSGFETDQSLAGSRIGPDIDVSPLDMSKAIEDLLRVLDGRQVAEMAMRAAHMNEPDLSS